jgi:hypothetical protein
MMMNSRIKIMTTTAIKLLPLMGSGSLWVWVCLSSAGQF